MFVKFHEKDKLHGIVTLDREMDAITNRGNNRQGSLELGHRYARMSIATGSPDRRETRLRAAHSGQSINKDLI